jgi:hypothetical protein
MIVAIVVCVLLLLGTWAIFHGAKKMDDKKNDEQFKEYQNNKLMAWHLAHFNEMDKPK